MIIIKLLIAGSRSIENFDLSTYISQDTTLIVCGGANGIDTLAEKYADKNKISKLVLRPRYDKYGKAAPLKRNEIMVDIADSILIIWDGISRGTVYTLKYAEKKEKDITVITVTK